MKSKCPFCGYPPPHTMTSFRSGYSGRCRNCSATGPVRKTEREAQVFWDLRI